MIGRCNPQCKLFDFIELGTIPQSSLLLVVAYQTALNLGPVFQSVLSGSSYAGQRRGRRNNPNIYSTLPATTSNILGRFHVFDIVSTGKKGQQARTASLLLFGSRRTRTRTG